MSISCIDGQVNCNYRPAALSEVCAPLYQYNRIKMLYPLCSYIATSPCLFILQNTHTPVELTNTCFWKEKANYNLYIQRKMTVGTKQYYVYNTTVIVSVSANNF